MKGDRLKLHAFWNSLASNTASPFVGFNVTASGASDLLIGYVQAIGSLASAVSQLVGGRIADRSGRRALIAVVSSLVVGVLWMGSALVQSPAFLAVSFTAITLVVGFYLAGWTSLIGEASEKTEKGSFLSTYARLQTVGALGALLLTTAITAYYPSYSALYLLSGIFFVVSAMVLRGQKEQRVEKAVMSEAGTANLKRYYLVSGVYGLFWGFAWPLFTITLVKVVNMDLFEYSLSQVIGAASTIAFQPVVGRLVDRDRKKAVFWGRMGLVAYPLVYMFFSAPWQVYVVNVFSGLTNALLNVAFVAHLYDISPAGQRGRYSAEFNLITGIATMAGSLAAGYALSVLSATNTLWLSLAYLYVIAAVGRAIAALLHLRLPYGRKLPEPVGETGGRAGASQNV
ncbi:MAG TPA: MFS transporter [Nitrososphaerales archaeon]|nr:MFS transporter [Nitrososphaerales archaeon]